MITVTSVAVGNSGINLEGTLVNGNVRESVVLSDPETQDAFAKIVSSQPISMYGLPVWIQGTPSIAIAGTVPIAGTASTQIVSSIPFYVAQSSAPWTMNGGVAVTNTPTVNVTNVPAVNISSSIPFFVAQSSAPWSFSPTGTTLVNIVSTVTQASNITSSIPFFVAQSSAPWSVNISTAPQPTGTTMVNIVSTVTQNSNITSSIPFFVAQSSAPWTFSEIATTAGGTNATTIALAANLNTTVVKASAGQVYGIFGSNIGSSNVFVRIYNQSTAALTIASTAVPSLVFGMPISSSPLVLFDMAVAFPAGITLITQQQPYTASTSLAPTASTATLTILFK